MLSSKEVAKKYDVHISRVSRWRRAGKLEGSYVKISGRYKYDEDELDKCVKENINPLSRERGQRIKKYKNLSPEEIERENKKERKQISNRILEAGMGKLTLADAQVAQAQYKAALLKLDYEQKSGLLIKKEQVEMDFFNCARRTRDAILNIPDRISAELANMTNQYEINQKLVTELNAALEELSH